MFFLSYFVAIAASASLGIKAPLAVQAIVLFGSVVWLKSNYVKRKEIAALGDVLGVALCWIAMAIGDIIYYFNWYDGSTPSWVHWLKAIYTP